jgi:hypothetical protein
VQVSFELNYAMMYFRDQGLYAEIRDGKLVVRNGENWMVLREVVDELYYVEESYPDPNYVGMVLDIDQIVATLKSEGFGAI